MDDKTTRSGNGAIRRSLEDIQVIDDLWSINADDGAQVLAFWKREGAFNDDAQAQARLPEIIAHARDAAGEVIAVCTAVACTLPRLAQPMYYYRCFIGRTWRSSRLVMKLLRHSKAALENHAQTNDFPCIGILLELENARFSTTLQRPYWPGIGFTYIGKGQRGLDMRVCYFHGAKLKQVSANP